MDQKKRKRVAKKIRELMEDYQSPKADEDDEKRDVLYDYNDFASELAVALAPIGSQNITTDRLRDMVKKQALRGMYKTDDKDEYYDYKNRFKSAEGIVNKVMHLIQRGEEFQYGNDPKFTQYNNVSNDMRISESTENFDEEEIRSYVREALSEFSGLNMASTDKKRAVKTKRKFEKAVESGSPIRYQNLTIDPNVAKTALEMPEKLGESEEAFFARPLTAILSIATEHHQSE